MPGPQLKRADHSWISKTLPCVIDDPERAVASATARSATRAEFFEALGWEVASRLQVMWALGNVTLLGAQVLANELSEHLMRYPLSPTGWF